CLLQCLTVELQDGSGVAVRTIPIKATPIYSHSSVRRWTFNERVPWHADTRSIVIRRGEETLAQWSASSSFPQVRVQSPNGGESLTNQDAVMVTWDASDAD